MDKPKYDPQAIEKKWQQYWKEKKTFHVEVDPKRPKYYVLDMFPYPSGAGLHVGHLVGYTATDVLARHKSQKGFNVLHPMGWDSFGLPAEQYAIRTGTHPELTTKANIRKFRDQLQAVGYAYDWERELMTSDPRYYKWSQWIFTKLYEKGLAYQAELLVNYCPALGTVLANEEIENGLSKEGGHPIERRPLRQWVLKITAYADRLLNDLEPLNWPEGLKKLQQNWIGKSEGARIDFPLTENGDVISVFTTRPDTLFGVSYLVLSPEHPLVPKITKPSHSSEVAHYQRLASSKSDLERTELAKEKSGAFTGSFALHPITGERIPIWIADYVLIGYGTGAVMGVPSHDERDYEFACRYGIPIVAVIAPADEEKKAEILAGKVNHYSGEGVYINSAFLDGLPSGEEGKKRMIAWLEENGRGKKTISYKLRDWLFSRQRYWGEPFPVLHFEDGSIRILDLDELPLTLPEMTDFKPSPTGESPLARIRTWVEGIDPKTGKKSLRETNTMPQWAGSCWYYLRFCDPHNDKEAWSKEAEKYWMNVDMYIGGAEHAVLHLLYARFWHKVLYDLGLVSTPEPFQTLCNQGLIVARSFKRDGHYVNHEEVVERGGKYFHWETGEELQHQIEKMSKSKLNGVSPDEVIEEFGADAMRLYVMFLGPIDKEKVWHTPAVSGCRRFLNRFYDMATSEKVTEEESEEGLRLGHRLIEGVSSDIENLLFNTAVAKMMEFMNDFTRLPAYPKSVVRMAVQALSPFAPHIAEELWRHLGEKGSVAHAPLPEVNPKYLVDEQVTYVVQVNGKVRGRFELPKDQPQEVILKLAQENPIIAKYLTGEIQKVVFVPNKLLSIVIA